VSAENSSQTPHSTTVSASTEGWSLHATTGEGSGWSAHPLSRRWHGCKHYEGADSDDLVERCPRRSPRRTCRLRRPGGDVDTGVIQNAAVDGEWYGLREERSGAFVPYMLVQG
jgi:hypothetical protein